MRLNTNDGDFECDRCIRMQRSHSKSSSGRMALQVGESLRSAFVNHNESQPKVTHQSYSSTLGSALELISEQGLPGMADAIRVLVNEAMKIQRADFLDAQPHERAESRRGYANGYKPKTVATRVGEIEFAVPQVRDRIDGERFYPSALEKGIRSERALKLAVAEMYVQGVSTRKVAAITEELCGVSISSTQVSRAAALLDEELDRWRNRELGKCRYLILDARYEKVRHGGSVVSAAVLIAIGVDEHGRRSILGVSVSRSEAEVHWRDFLDSLRTRGLHGLRMIVSDDHAGLRQALSAAFTGVAWQRCQFHLQRNAAPRVPKIAMRADVARQLRAIFNAPDQSEAERLLDKLLATYESTAPELASWARDNVPHGFAVFELPPSHRRCLRTTNMLERINKELLRRTRVATLFPNDASLLRLVTAVLMEVTEDWETGRRYLSMDAE